MPDAHFVLSLTDERPGMLNLEDEGFDEVLFLDDYADYIQNPRGWAFGHTVMELATAVKPFTASMLMERADCDAVMFFDPDCVLFGPMSDMRHQLTESSVLLTPHASLLHENDDWLFFEKGPLKVGGFNLGFFAFQNTETGREVSSWWRYRLMDHCLIDPEQGLFTDQKWIDLLPNYIDDLKVMREPVYNVARWNTFQRKISKKDGVYLADGNPVQFIHFSGFYKIGPYVKGLYDKTSEPLVENKDILEELSLWYSEALAGSRSHPIYELPWQFGSYKNGEAIVDADRRRYKASKELQRRYPDPFATDSFDSFWLYCRKLDRVEAETRLSKSDRMFNIVARGVQTNNSILRTQIEALEKQLVNTTADLNNSRTAEMLHSGTIDRIKASIKDVMPWVQKKLILELFSPVAESGNFDAQAYLETNLDVAESGVDPLEHFIRDGIFEDRNSHPMSADMFFECHIDLFIQLLSKTPQPIDSKSKFPNISVGSGTKKRNAFGRSILRSMVRKT
ncbi:hypothetical protein BV911_18270 [Pseudoruegeria sp. SK021]|nr:hypothetical protein BV911_18270 [Pseudoruegeria sp. SK021]